jgi:hypothetical protein
MIIWKSDFLDLIFFKRPTPNAQRPTPNAQRPTPNAQRPTPNAQRPTPSFPIWEKLPGIGTEIGISTAINPSGDRYLITSNENNEKNPVPCNAVNPVVFMQP